MSINNSVIQRNIIVCIAAYCAIYALQQPTHAVEGPTQRGAGQWGVNRRITSDVEFTRAKGDFTIEHGVPGVYDPARGEVLPTAATNPKNSSPSVYLGGSGPGRFQDREDNYAWKNSNDVEVDAGLQWDWSDTPDRPRGWVAFISVVRVQVNPAIYNSIVQDYQPWRGKQRNYGLDYAITSEGHAKLSVNNSIDGFGTFYWNRAAMPTNFNGSVWPNQPNSDFRVMDVSRLHENRVKRVVAITRNEPHTHAVDGSYLMAAFRNGRIYDVSGTEHTWTWVNTNGVPTGYDSPGNGATGGGGMDAVDAVRPGGKLSTLSRYKVDFPKIDGATVTPKTELIKEGREAGVGSAQRTEGAKSRYESETTRINLRTWQSLVGRRVRRF